MEPVRFEELGIDDRILRAVTEMGFEEATPIQAKAIPEVMTGQDIIGQAQTGTGKSGFFRYPDAAESGSEEQACSGNRSLSDERTGDPVSR